ncbi:MAG: EamA family transporter [Eubacteriales bacterium]
MIYLILAIICSSCITLVLKIGSKYTENRYAMLTCNYITCVIMAIIFMPKNTAIFSDVSGRMAMVLGLVNGILYLVCMSYNQINVVKNGAILTATFVRLGVVVPTLLSILFYKEIPSVVQVVGIFLVLIAFVLMGMSGKGNKDIEVKIVLRDLILLMILGGITDSMSKVFEQTCSMELADWFLLITFFVALVICIIVTIYKHQKIGKKECVVGVAIGIPNYLSTLFLLQSLGKIPAFLAYPTYSVGSILVVITVSYILLREKLDKMQKVSVGFIMLALLFLNM